jgi:hypothetical protein
MTPCIAALRDASFAFYHARRSVTNGQWSTLVLPLPDFVCWYGQGRRAESFQKQRALTGEQVFAIAFLSPYGQRRQPTVVYVKELSFARVPGAADDLRSYWQAPAPRR